MVCFNRKNHDQILFITHRENNMTERFIDVSDK